MDFFKFLDLPYYQVKMVYITLITLIYTINIQYIYYHFIKSLTIYGAYCTNLLLICCNYILLLIKKKFL